MGHHVIEAKATSKASREQVWRLIADITTWSDWGGWSSATREREGDPPPDGVGAVRKLKRFPTTTVEEVTAFEPNARLGYKLLKGLPLRDYAAEITLGDAPAGGTEITWRAEFDTTWVPGIKTGLERFFPTTVEQLARGAETG